MQNVFGLNGTDEGFSLKTFLHLCTFALYLWPLENTFYMSTLAYFSCANLMFLKF